MNEVLYRVCPEYRRVVDELHRTQQAHGALEAAYRNALGDQSRLRGQLDSAGIAHRDDPGRGGSGGQRPPTTHQVSWWLWAGSDDAR